MAVGFVMHSFRITQMINGADDISLLMKGYGGGTTFGRWGLDFFGFRVNYKWLIGSFNLSVFDGLVTLFFLSLSACFILCLFHLQQSRLGLLFAVIFAYTGFTCTTPSEQQWTEVYGTNEFQEMSCYPDDGSIAVIDEVIVVKIAE